MSYVAVVLRKRCSWPLVPEFIAMRVQQFFDKLMGKPAPKWVTEGVGAKDKGRDNSGWLCYLRACSHSGPR